MNSNNSLKTIGQWQRFEQSFISARQYANPLQQAELWVTFVSPSGRQHKVEGFWDGDMIWRVRFAPDEVGDWSFSSQCTDSTNEGLAGRSGAFTCQEPDGTTRFDQHGPIHLSPDRRHLMHTDGTPFFWLADTVWNGPLRATIEEWNTYLDVRVSQKFTAVQWVASQWLAAPDGDLKGEVAFTGIEQITVNPAFFQRLDQKMDATRQAGLLNVPVLLWAAEWSSDEVNKTNPGYILPEEQAILLARYMVARWSADNVVWILPGDSDYRGDKAARWKRIGRALFGDTSHAPVSLHPAGMHWNLKEFCDESWLDIIGYQSGHGDDDDTLAWLVNGPPATDWSQLPTRPFINLEPPYEDHIAYQSQKRIDAAMVRRALYWSLLVSPTSGVTYGGHGVWGWDDGSAPPVGHPNTGIALPWQKALTLPAAEQVRHLVGLFESVEWWRLQPSPELVVAQPGTHDKRRFVMASKSIEGDLAVVYIPEDREIDLNLACLPDDLSAIWFDPRTGARQSVSLEGGLTVYHFQTPSSGDWILLLGRTLSLPAHKTIGMKA